MRKATFITGRQVLSAIAVAVMAAACGGGGGGSVDGTVNPVITDDPAPPMPANVNFTFGTKASAPLALSTPGVVLSYPRIAFAGTWNRMADTWTMRGQADVESGAQLFGNFSARAIDPAQFSADDTPTAGKLEYVAPPGNTFIPAGAIMQVTVGAQALVVNMTNLIDHTYAWDVFLDMWTDTNQHPTERLASFGVNASGLVADRGKMVLDLMAAINVSDQQIQTAAGYATQCSPRPGAGTGSRLITLASQDGHLNPGDTVLVTYTNCWVDDPSDSIDVLLNGTVTMAGYIESKSPFATGFDEIRFNLSENETETVGGTVMVMQPAVSTNGTMTLFVSP